LAWNTPKGSEEKKKEKEKKLFPRTLQLEE
jgi:hypothetical protein